MIHKCITTYQTKENNYKITDIENNISYYINIRKVIIKNTHKLLKIISETDLIIINKFKIN
jgi:hypothetical protein